MMTGFQMRLLPGSLGWIGGSPPTSKNRATR
jgi:hypothetical protein